MSEPTPPELPGWLARMFPDGMRRRMVDVDGVHVHVAEWGEGRPVLLLHGNPSWGFIYRKVVAELLASPAAEPLRLIVPDLVGLGCSDKPRDPSIYTVVNQGRWIGNLIDRLGLHDFIFVAQDWGAPIGLHALEHRVGRVRAMVIQNTMFDWPPRPGYQPSKFHQFSHRKVLSDLVFKLGGFPQNGMLLAQGNKRSIVGKTQLAYVWPLRKIRDRTMPLAMSRMVPNADDHPSSPAFHVAAGVLTSFTGPTAVVWGVRDPILGDCVDHLAERVPAAVVTRTQGGHFLQEESPLEIAAAIRDVVSRAAAN